MLMKMSTTGSSRLASRVGTSTLDSHPRSRHRALHIYISIQHQQQTKRVRYNYWNSNDNIITTVITIIYFWNNNNKNNNNARSQRNNECRFKWTIYIFSLNLY